MGFEVLAIQDVPTQVLEYAVRCGYTDCQFMRLAGNSFTAELVAAFFIAALVEYPLEGEQEDDKLPEISASVLKDNVDVRTQEVEAVGRIGY